MNEKNTENIVVIPFYTENNATKILVEDKGSKYRVLSEKRKLKFIQSLEDIGVSKFEEHFLHSIKLLKNTTGYICSYENLEVRGSGKVQEETCEGSVYCLAINKEDLEGYLNTDDYKWVELEEVHNNTYDKLTKEILDYFKKEFC